MKKPRARGDWAEPLCSTGAVSLAEVGPAAEAARNAALPLRLREKQMVEMVQSDGRARMMERKDVGLRRHLCLMEA